MKIAVDPGHGMGNRKAGRYDCGALGEGCEEAAIALEYGLTLKYLLTQQSADVFLTRTSRDDPAPVSTRAARAAAAGCDHLVSLHLNSASGVASGVEVLYRDEAKDKPLAVKLERKLVEVTGFRSRGVIPRKNLAVLRFAAGPAVLIELGFINNPEERDVLLHREHRIAVCQAVVEALVGEG